MSLKHCHFTGIQQMYYCCSLTHIVVGSNWVRVTTSSLITPKRIVAYNLDTGELIEIHSHNDSLVDDWLFLFFGFVCGIVGERRLIHEHAVLGFNAAEYREERIAAPGQSHSITHLTKRSSSVQNCVCSGQRCCGADRVGVSCRHAR
jgi:hypothetical protein